MNNEVSINNLKVSITKEKLKNLINDELDFSLSMDAFEIQAAASFNPKDTDIHFYLFRKRGTNGS